MKYYQKALARFLSFVILMFTLCVPAMAADLEDSREWSLATGIRQEDFEDSLIDWILSNDDIREFAFYLNDHPLAKTLFIATLTVLIAFCLFYPLLRKSLREKKRYDQYLRRYDPQWEKPRASFLTYRDPARKHTAKLSFWVIGGGSVLLLLSVLISDSIKDYLPIPEDSSLWPVLLLLLVGISIIILIILLCYVVGLVYKRIQNHRGHRDENDLSPLRIRVIKSGGKAE